MIDFKQAPCPQVFYMPLWTEQESETIAPYFPAALDWHNRFEILGGIPRHVLEVPDEDPRTLLEAVCYECDLNDCIKIFGVNSTITKNRNVHYLVHITSTPPFTQPSVSYASATALDIMARIKKYEVKQNE